MILTEITVLSSLKPAYLVWEFLLEPEVTDKNEKDP
jgi:hypothetical protein